MLFIIENFVFVHIYDTEFSYSKVIISLSVL